MSKHAKSSPDGSCVSSIGGQALLEGVMMQSPAGIALSVRREDGEIVSEYKDYIPLKDRNKLCGLPIVRGCVSFVASLVNGMKVMSRGVELLGLEEEEPSKFEKWLSKTLGKDIEQVVIAAAVTLAIGLACLLFIVIPAFIGAFVGRFTDSQIAINTAEGVSKVLIFLGYLSSISLMKDIRRVFMYHGAEHKTIACYEAGLELTPENAKNCSRFHPRCGTNYLFLVIMISILITTLVSYTGPVWGKIGIKLLLLPFVAGISYEVLKWAARGETIFNRIVRWPGMKLQYLTTREPDDSMLEVAIASFKLALDPAEYKAREAEKAASEAGGNKTGADKAEVFA